MARPLFHCSADPTRSWYQSLLSPAVVVNSQLSCLLTNSTKTRRRHFWKMFCNSDWASDWSIEKLNRIVRINYHLVQMYVIFIQKWKMLQLSKVFWKYLLSIVRSGLLKWNIKRNYIIKCTLYSILTSGVKLC